MLHRSRTDRPVPTILMMLLFGLLSFSLSLHAEQQTLPADADIQATTETAETNQLATSVVLTLTPPPPSGPSGMSLPALPVTIRGEANAAVPLSTRRLKASPDRLIR